VVKDPTGAATKTGQITIPGAGNLTNAAFGGTDHKTLYVTAQGTGMQRGVFKLAMPIPGLPYRRATNSVQQSWPSLPHAAGRRWRIFGGPARGGDMPASRPSSRSKPSKPSPILLVVVALAVSV